MTLDLQVVFSNLQFFVPSEYSRITFNHNLFSFILSYFYFNYSTNAYPLFISRWSRFSKSSQTITATIIQLTNTNIGHEIFLSYFNHPNFFLLLHFDLTLVLFALSCFSLKSDIWYGITFCLLHETILKTTRYNTILATFFSHGSSTNCKLIPD